MRWREDGFTLVELMITLTILVMALAASASVFTGLLTQFKQESKIAETSVEGVIGLEIMRQDLEAAGLGVPWDLNGMSYNEVASAPYSTMNDGPPNNPARAGDHSVAADTAGVSNTPAPIRSAPNQGPLNLSDILAVKSVTVANNKTAGGWTLIACGPKLKTGLSGYTFSNSDNVITLIPATRQLVVNAGIWHDTYGNVGNYAPPQVGGACDPADTYIVYGLADNKTTTTIRMPFNRADYYVKVPANLPQRCAQGTGVLYKGVISQKDGSFSNELPLLDCVAIMKVSFGLDVENNGVITSSTDLSAKTAANIISQLKEVRVSILAQEGQYDFNYTYPNTTVTLGTGYNFDIKNTIANYQHYRWKQYNLIVRTNLSGS